MKFKDREVNFEKLIKFGFEKAEEGYVYRTKIFDNQFKMTVKIAEDGEVQTELFDFEAEEFYTLHLVSEASGEFVGKVRAEHGKVLDEICEKCFESSILGGQLTKKVARYARERYGDELEFLWERYTDAAIIRRRDNRKWYALFMTVAKSKLGLEGNEPAEIIDLRFDADELPKKVDGKRYFPGYHMNKKHWITMLLDGSVPLKEILMCLDESYKSAK